MNLDEFVQRPWPGEICSALDEWQQGDIVDTGKTLVWTGPGGDDSLTGVSGSEPLASRTLITAKQPDGTGLSVITSQTCDVIGFGQGAKHPWVQVSPVCKVTDPGTIANLRDGKLLSQFLVTGDLGFNGTYAVDLRFNHPISKAVLVGQERRPAFADTDLPLFAERLATKAGRVSLHDLIGTSLARALGDLVKAERASGTWDPSVEQFRIGISKGTALVPRAFFLLVVTDVDPTGDLAKKVQNCVEQWKKANRKALRAAAISVEPVQVRGLGQLAVTTYRDTAHLAVPDLTQRFWF